MGIFGLGHMWIFLKGLGLGLCIIVGVLACIFCLESLYESSLGLEFGIDLLRVVSDFGSLVEDGGIFFSLESLLGGR